MASQTSEPAACSHIPEDVVGPRAESCEACGSRTNLRVCVTCGHVGCCESQHGHNTAHARSAGHPVIRSLPISSRSFTWCYECGRYL
jgi:uncharacterized UBP type Zn finger protein